RIQRVRSVDPKIERAIDQSGAPLNVMPDVPVETRLNCMCSVNKRCRVRDIELEVITGYSKPCTKPHGCRVGYAGIGDVGDQVENVVRRSWKQISQVDTKAMT